MRHAQRLLLAPRQQLRRLDNAFDLPPIQPVFGQALQHWIGQGVIVDVSTVVPQLG